MSPFERWLLWVSTGLVAATGIALGWMKYLLPVDDPYAAVRHPLQPLVLKLHLLSAPALVFAFGAVFTRHVVRQWRAGRARGRPSGVGIAVTLPPMVLSGYLVQTVSSERWVFRAAMLHIAASLAYLAVLGVHQLAARRAAREAPSGMVGPAEIADPDA